MFIADLTVGGISWHIESDIKLSRLDLVPFSMFREPGSISEIGVTFSSRRQFRVGGLFSLDNGHPTVGRTDTKRPPRESGFGLAAADSGTGIAEIDIGAIATVLTDNHRLLVRDFSQRRILVGYGRPDLAVGRTVAEQLVTSLREHVASMLPLFDAAMVHSSAVLLDNQVAVFLAPSGGGKSTIASLAEPGTVLSDDQNVLRNQDGVMMVHSTPFGKTTDGPRSAKLGGLFLLEKSGVLKLSRATGPEVLEAMWADQPGATYLLPTEVRLRLFEVLYRTCQSTPCYRLAFPPDTVDWEKIGLAMGARTEIGSV